MEGWMVVCDWVGGDARACLENPERPRKMLSHDVPKSRKPFEPLLLARVSAAEPALFKSKEHSCEALGQVTQEYLTWLGLISKVFV